MRIRAVVEFDFLSDPDLDGLSDAEIAKELKALLENEFCGLAEYGSAVVNIQLPVDRESTSLNSTVTIDTESPLGSWEEAIRYSQTIQVSGDTGQHD
jgi:hypothetical protein